MSLATTVLLVGVLYLGLSNAYHRRPEYDQEGLDEGIRTHIRATTAADFDKHAKKWVEAKAKEWNTDLQWFDLYGKHSHLRERPQYKKYQVLTEVTDVVYKEHLKRSVDRPNSVYSQWFHNSQAKQPLVSKMEKSIVNKNVFSWTVQKNLNIGVSVEASASLPGILNVKANVSTNIDLRKSNTETKETEETFSISYTITVEPKTSVKADWTITEREIEIPWEANIILTGYVAMWVEPQHDGHWLWFIPVSSLQGGPFKWHPKGLVYKASGSFKSVVGIDSIVKTEEYPLMATSARNGLEDVIAKQSLPLKVHAEHFPVNNNAGQA